MSRKGENIFKRKDGRWEARYEKDRAPNGRIIYGFCYAKSYREVRAKVNELKAAVCLGKPMDTNCSRALFGAYCDKWLAEKEASTKMSTYVKYRGIIDRHLRPILGEYRLMSIDSGAVLQVKDRMVCADLSSKTIHDAFTVLKAILIYINRDVPSFNPNIISIKLPAAEVKEARVLSLGEEVRLINYLKDDMNECKFGILLAVMTGLRIGEICALQWKNISIDEATLRVDATMLRLPTLSGPDNRKTSVIISKPKSPKSMRTIPLTAECIDLCSKMVSNDPTAFVLTGKQHYMEPRALQYRLKKYVTECRLCGVHFHTLRHTFATRAIEVGFEIKSLSEILGHATTNVTIERYVHASMSLKRENMNKMTALFE